MKKKYATNSEKTYYYLRWFCMTALLLAGLSGIGSKVCGQKITAKIIVTADDPAIQHQVEFETNQDNTTATLTFSNLPANKEIKTVKVKEGTAGKEVEVTPNDKNTYTFNMPTPDNIYYVTVTTKEKDDATYSITTNVTGVDKSLLEDLGESDATVKGTSVTIDPQQTKESKKDGTIEIINITAHATDGSWTAIPAKDDASSLTFEMPAANVIVTIRTKSTTIAKEEAPKEDAQEVTAPEIAIPAESLPKEEDRDKLQLSVAPAPEEENISILNKVEELIQSDRIPASLAENLVVSDIKLINDSNNEVQPTGPVTITLPYPEGADQSKVFRILHLHDAESKNGDYCIITPRAVTAGLQFEADHFSLFGILYASTVSATGVSISPDSKTLNKGETVQLTATVLPTDATDKTVIWSSSNNDIASVDNKGEVTAVGPGTATITATANDGSGKAASCRITVNEPYTPPAIVHVTGISLDRETATIKKGSILQLSATVTPSNADDKTVRWESSNTDVATVDDNGKVTAIAPGTATITVTTTDQRKTATCSVTVTDIDIFFFNF
ncbi:MAG: Ig-like domain-containing protein [Parabacteroides gordonii]|nr:Ig-like domain-containing protein [Parabacteroides gordonii]